MVDQRFFIGREKELQDLRRLSDQPGPKLVVIKGRRRIGKSRLAAEFAKDRVFLSFTGLPPAEGVTAQQQRDAFAGQFCQMFGLPPMRFSDWSDAFNHLTQRLTDQPTVVLFDEISWMGSKDPTFIPKLKIWWDLYLEKFPNLMLIFCGSVSTWIEKNIIRSTSFFGRISHFITLRPLSLPECGAFLRAKGFMGSIYECYQVLCVTGGIPWYLEKISPSLMAEENIRRLCFDQDSLLLGEFDRIFHDLFDTHGKVHGQIVRVLAEGDKTQKDIQDALNYPRSGSLSTLLDDLIISGFVTKHYQWSLSSDKPAKQSLYRLSDCYVRFYLKYIEPNRPKIEQGTFSNVSIHQLPAWENMMGLQLETLLLQNRELLIKSVGINPADIANDNPFLQRATSTRAGCQVDYLIQTRSLNLFVCEFKYNRRTIGYQIIDEMKDKISRLAYPRIYGVVPILFHLGEVADSVYDKQYFFRIVDISDYIEVN